MVDTLEVLMVPRTDTATEAPRQLREEFVSPNATQFAVARVETSLSSLIAARTTYGTVTDRSDRNFALSLRRIQSHSGLNWGEIARTIGVSRRTVHNWLTDMKVNGMNAARVAGLYRAITQELTSVPRTQARSHLLAPGPDGVTPLARITLDLRSQYPVEKPIIAGFDLLRSPSSAEPAGIVGGLEQSIPTVDLGDDAGEGI